eukprot:5193194-Pleurochrysis_carterae.AAC.3
MSSRAGPAYSQCESLQSASRLPSSLIAGELYECLHDYNTAIIRTSLQVAARLHTEFATCASEMRCSAVVARLLTRSQLTPSGMHICPFGAQRYL